MESGWSRCVLKGKSVMNEGRKVRTAVRILEILNNQTAIVAYQAALEDDAERYNELKFNIYISRKNNYIC